MIAENLWFEKQTRDSYDTVSLTC